MIRKRSWRYYCEHCKKSGGSAAHIQRHERGCTNNPKRVCGLCAHVKEEQRPIEELIAALTSSPEDNYAEGLKRVRDLTNHCPACILAAIRQAKVQRKAMWNWDTDTEIDPGCHVDFDFRDELKSWWSDTNAAENECVYYG